MSELGGEAIIELRGDDRQLKKDIKDAASAGGKSFGDSFDKETRKGIGKSFRDSILSAATRANTVLNIAGLVGPAILAIGAAGTAAASGLVAVAGAIGPGAVAGAAAFAGALLAVKSAIAVTKFAFAGLDKAIAGDAKAMQALNPAARGFATVLKGLKPRIDGIRAQVQRGLFPDLAKDTTKLANTYFPMFRRAALGLGNQLGRLANDGTKMVASGPWRKDFAAVAKANTRNVGLFGHAGLQLADALRSLFVTAQPLIHSFAQFTLKAATAANKATQAARASGELSSFWDRAAATGAQLGRILGNLAIGLGNVFRIGGSTQGKDTLTNVEGLSRQFRDWTRSSAGFVKISAFFETGNKNLGAMGRLIKAVSVGLAGIGAGGMLAPLIDQITKELVPPLIEFLAAASNSGALSALISAAASLAQVFADLASQNGSLIAFSTTLRAVGDAAQWVLEHVPGASQALSALFIVLGAGAALKLVGLGGIIKGVGTAFGIMGDRALVSTGILSANTGAVAANSLVYRLSMSTMGTWIGVKGLEAAAWVRSTALARAYSVVMGSTAGKLGAAAIGIGGVAAAAQKGGGALSVLGGAASGAVAGAALGSFAPGPGTAIGAAIGGTVGLAAGLLTLSKRTKTAGDAAGKSISSYSGLASTLDQLTFKTTAATRAMVFQDLVKSKGIAVTRALGITDRDAVNAAVDGGRARIGVTTQIQKQITALEAEKKANDASLASQRGVGGQAAQAAAAQVRAKNKEIDARIANARAVQTELGAVDKATQKLRLEDVVTRTFSKHINSLPKKVQTDIRTNGMERTRAAVVGLTAQYGLARKDVRTLIKENGGKPTRAMVDSIIAAAKNLDRLHPSPTISVTNHATDTILNVKQMLAGIKDKTVNLTVNTTNDLAKGPGHASGGPVKPGVVYPVGERGTELAVFGANGQIISNATASRIAREALSGTPRPVSPGNMPTGLGGAVPTFNIHMPTGDPEAAAQAVWARWVLAGVGG